MFNESLVFTKILVQAISDSDRIGQPWKPRSLVEGNRRMLHSWMFFPLTFASKISSENGSQAKTSRVFFSNKGGEGLISSKQTPSKPSECSPQLTLGLGFLVVSNAPDGSSSVYTVLLARHWITMAWITIGLGLEQHLCQPLIWINELLGSFTSSSWELCSKNSWRGGGVVSYTLQR